MKAVVLAGGLGTRLAEETDVRPKPMVEVGDRPLLWHIMKHFGGFGVKEFVVALGYKGDVVKRWFLDYASMARDLRISLAEGIAHANGGPTPEPWEVELVDTGCATQTGGRVGRLADHLGGERFFLTYGDGVADVDLDALVAFHRSHGRLVTVTAVRPPSRFGGIEFSPDGSARFTEKPQMGEGWINGGFMVVEPEVLERIAGDGTSFEADVLEPLSREDEVMAFRHDGFWQCADTLRDLRYLRSLWDSGEAPWLTW